MTAGNPKHNVYVEGRQLATDAVTSTSNVLELKQEADDGTDRIIIRGSDGNVKSEIYFDGTDTVFNPLSGDVTVQGVLNIE